MPDYTTLDSTHADTFYDEAGRPRAFSTCPTCSTLWHFEPSSNDGVSVKFDGDCGHHFIVLTPAPA